MAKEQCGECRARVERRWNNCSNCGEKIERSEIPAVVRKSSRVMTYLTYGFIVIIVAAPIAGIVGEKDDDLLAQLKSRGVLAWSEDKKSDGLLSAGEATPIQAITTATGSCTLWIYPDEAKAEEALNGYINNNLEFSVAWSGVEKSTGRGGVLLALEANSFCSEEAADFLGWELE